MNKLLTKIVGVVLGTTMAVGVGVGVAVNSDRANVDSEVRASEISSGTTTYTFSSKSWEASPRNWTSGSDGAGFSNNGIQVTTTATGANGTSPDTFVNVSKIVLTYNTNKSKGAGTATVKVGTNTDTTKDWAYSGSSDGTSANFTLQYDYATAQSGAVKITLNTKTNSIYLVSCAVTCSSAPATYSVTYNANGATSGDVPTDGTNYSSGATVTVKGNTGSLAKTGFTWAGWNTKADGNGTDYAENATFTISANTTLYAKWIKTLDAITAISGTVIGSVSNAGTYNWDFSNVTVTGTLSGVSEQNVKSYVDLSSTTAIPGAATDSINVSVTATKKESVTGSATSYTNNAVSGSVEAAKLTYSVTFSYTEM